MMPNLKISQLTKSYPTPAEPLEVLRGIDLQLTPADQGTAILGPSGSGKSTFLHIVATLDLPTGGTIQLDEQNPFSLSPSKLAQFRNQHIGLVFQDHHLIDSLSALENVLLARLAMGKVRKEHESRAKQLLTSVGLADRFTHRPAELSGGQRQRVAIARALMNQPTLLLCDEPTGNLDASTAQEIGDLLVQLAADPQTIVLVATHSTKLASRFGRALFIQEGKLITQPNAIT